MFIFSRTSLAILALATLTSALPTAAKVVGERALAAACAKKAAQRMAMNESDVLTLPTDLMMGTYSVYAQVSPEDGSLIMAECKFDRRKSFTTISIDGKAYKGSGAASSGSSTATIGGAPKVATAA